jgi:hypothetical protein
MREMRLLVAVDAPGHVIHGTPDIVTAKLNHTALDDTNSGTKSTRFMARLAVVCVLTFAIHHFSNNEADVDLWGNVGFVRAMPWQKDFLFANTYSYTQPERHWVNHEWLAEYVYNRVFSFMGNPGLVLLKLVLGMTLLSILAATVRKNSAAGLINFFFLLLSVSTIGYGFSTRPHLFTYLFLAGLLTALERGWLRRPVMIPVWAAAAVVWTNAHGAFFIGIVALVLYGLASLFRGDKPCIPGDRREALIALSWAAVFCAASLLNPYGARLWTFVSGSAAIMRPYLSEWAPFNPIRDFASHVDFLVLAALSIPSILCPRRTELPQRVLLTVSLASALMMRRNIPLFALVSAFAVPAELDARLSAPVRRLQSAIRPAVAIAILALFASLNLVAASTFNKSKPLQMEVPRSKYAVDAIEYMRRSGLSGNLLVFFDWGEEAIWHLYPACRVFMDGRFESAYSTDVIEDYLAFIYCGIGWEKALANYPTDMVLSHTASMATDRMRSLRGWRLAYEDPVACLFLKEERHAAALTPPPGVPPGAAVNASTAIFP